MSTNVQSIASRSKTARWIGWVLSGLTILFMLFDGLTKLAMEHHVVEATAQIGYPIDVIRPLGIILLVCTILYAIPRTAIFGAVLLTGYLGGAVASKVRIEDPLWRVFRHPRLGWPLSSGRTTAYSHSIAALA
jgi:hypothetical protein